MTTSWGCPQPAASSPRPGWRWRARSPRSARSRWSPSPRSASRSRSASSSTPSSYGRSWSRRSTWTSAVTSGGPASCPPSRPSGHDRRNRRTAATQAAGLSKWARWPASGISASSAAHLGGESYLGSAILISRIRKPLHHQRHGPDREPIWRDIPVGLRHVWRTPFLRITLLCAAGINIVFAGLSLAIIAAQTAHGSAAAHIGAAFGMGAIGGILGAWAAAPLQRRIAPAGLVYIFGWTATLGLATLSETHNAYAIGALLAAVFFTATPANAMLFAVQIHITPPQL